MIRGELRPTLAQGDADFWKMRDLLVRTAPITPIGFNSLGFTEAYRGYVWRKVF